MRSAPIALSLFAFLALAGAGHSAVPALSCSGTCVVESSTAGGYSPALLVMQSGSVLEWISTMGSHASVGGGCLHGDAEYNDLGLVSDVRFEIAEGALFATTLDPNYGTPERCGGAFRVPDGSFSLSYSCPYHGNMNGHVLVRP